MTMKYTLSTGLLALGSLIGLQACDSFVEDIDGPVDLVVSDSLDNPEQVPFLVTGVREGFNDSYDAIAVISDLLADVGEFTQAVDGATFPTFGDIDRAELGTDNNTTDGVYNAVNEYRFLADDLLRRVNETIEFGEDDADVQRSATFAANFHGAIARYFLGTYFGTDRTTGGAPISTDPDNPSAPIPTAELYSQADALLATAAGSATDYEQRVINTIRARIALFGGNRGQAAQFAANGMVSTDAPYTANYAPTSTNNWWIQGGRGRTQVSINDRFNEYDQDDSRMLVEIAPPTTEGDGPFYRQALYLNNSDPLPFATWQENALILAEADVFDGGDDNDARDRINAVRASRGLDAIDDGDAITQDVLIEARDRELFTQGQRLVDQRRFGIFHIPGGFQYFPLSETERNANPNV